MEPEIILPPTQVPNHKPLIIILISLVIILLGLTTFIGLKYFQLKYPQTKTPTQIVTSPIPTSVSNLKTFENSAFSLQYPSTWFVPGSEVFGIFLVKEPTFGITVSSSVNKYDLKKYCSNPVQSIIFAGLKAEEIKCPGPQESMQVYIQVFANNKYYLVSYVNSFDVKTLEETSQILSTFKFTDSTVRTVPASSVYLPDQLTAEEKKLIANFSWPKLQTGQKYLVDCQVTNDDIGINLIGIPTEIPASKNIAEITLKKLLENHYGGFPDSAEILNYEKLNGKKFINKDVGINGIVLKSDGTLAINFYDSVGAYGGGSSRVACMRYATDFTMLQFPTIKKVEMCIDAYCSGNFAI